MSVFDPFALPAPVRCACGAQEPFTLRDLKGTIKRQWDSPNPSER